MIQIVCRAVRLLARHGLFGRKKQVVQVLSIERDSGFRINRNKYDDFYQGIAARYKEIRVHKLWSTRIGEYVPRYLTAVEDARINAENGILDVFVLSDCVNHNARLSEIMGRHIQIINENNVDMWIDTLQRFPKVYFMKYWDQYAQRNRDRLLRSEDTAKYFELTSEEEAEGQEKKRRMGINGPFVCVSSRDPAFLAVTRPQIDCSYHDYRDSDINKLNLVSEYFQKEGITLVRMGRYVQGKVSFHNCIDYSNKYYDELMDLVLMRDCKFYLGDSNGTCVFPMTLNRPVALKNVIPAFSDMWGTHPQNPLNLVIFKKYYSKKDKKYLSIKEMMLIEKQVNFNGHKYKELGIEVVENTPEEILDLAVEMNARIDGEWIDTPEDIELQNKYQALVWKWCEDEGMKKNAMFHGRAGALFLRKNPFLFS